jgi:hypothetical protein
MVLIGLAILGNGLRVLLILLLDLVDLLYYISPFLLALPLLPSPFRLVDVFDFILQTFQVLVLL